MILSRADTQPRRNRDAGVAPTFVGGGYHLVGYLWPEANVPRNLVVRFLPGLPDFSYPRKEVKMFENYADLEEILEDRRNDSTGAIESAEKQGPGSPVCLDRTSPSDRGALPVAID